MFLVGVVFVVLMQVSACITSPKMQATVIAFAGLYCFFVGIGLPALGAHCRYTAPISGSNARILIIINRDLVQQLMFRVVAQSFVFYEMIRYYVLVQEQSSLAEQLFFGKF